MSGSVWVASYVMLWVTVVILGLAVVAMLRQIGVLHARLRPTGVHFAGEGPERLKPAPLPSVFDYGASRLTLITFTAPGCVICAQIRPGIRALEQQYDDVSVQILDHGPATEATFRTFNVTSTPYVVTVGRDGIVQGRGVANSVEQVEVLIEESFAAEAGAH
jgi:hypothetical protein